MLIVRSASAPDALSSMRPMIGSTKDTDSIPRPPMIERPSAPLSGRRSEISASVVGQKKVTPTAKTAAAMNTKPPDAGEGRRRSDSNVRGFVVGLRSGQRSRVDGILQTRFIG